MKRNFFRRCFYSIRYRLPSILPTPSNVTLRMRFSLKWNFLCFFSFSEKLKIKWNPKVRYKSFYLMRTFSSRMRQIRFKSVWREKFALSISRNVQWHSVAFSLYIKNILCAIQVKRFRLSFNRFLLLSSPFFSIGLIIISRKFPINWFKDSENQNK